VPLGRATREASLSPSQYTTAATIWMEQQLKTAKTMEDTSQDAMWLSPSRAGVLEFACAKACWSAMDQRPGFPLQPPRLKSLRPSDYIPSAGLLQSLVRLQEEGNLTFPAEPQDVQLAHSVLAYCDPGRHSTFPAQVLAAAVKMIQEEAEGATASKQSQGWAALRRLQFMGDRLILSMADEGVYSTAFPRHHCLTAASRCCQALVECMTSGSHTNQVWGEDSMALMQAVLGYRGGRPSLAQMDIESEFSSALGQVRTVSAALLAESSVQSAPPPAAPGAQQELSGGGSSKLQDLPQMMRNTMHSMQDVMIRRRQRSTQESRPPAPPKAPAKKPGKKAAKKQGKATPASAHQPQTPAAAPLATIVPIVWRLVDCGPYYVLQADVLYQMHPSRVPPPIAVAMRSDVGRLRTSAGNYVPPRLPQQHSFSGFMDTYKAPRKTVLNLFAIDPIHGVYEVAVSYAPPSVTNCLYSCPSTLQAIGSSSLEEDCAKFVQSPQNADKGFFDKLFESLQKVTEEPFNFRRYAAPPRPPLRHAALMSFKDWKKHQLMVMKGHPGLLEPPAAAEVNVTKVQYEADRSQAQRDTRSHEHAVMELQAKKSRDENAHRQNPPVHMQLRDKPLYLTSMVVCNLAAMKHKAVCVAVIETFGSTERLRGFGVQDQLHILCPATALADGQQDFKEVSGSDRLKFGLDQDRGSWGFVDIVDELRLFKASLNTVSSELNKQIQFRPPDRPGEDMEPDCLAYLSMPNLARNHLYQPLAERTRSRVWDLQVVPMLQQALLTKELAAANAHGFNLQVSQYTLVKAQPEEIRVLPQEPARTVKTYFHQRHVLRFSRGIYSNTLADRYPLLQHTPVVVPSPWTVSTQGLLDLIEHSCITDDPGFLQFVRNADSLDGLTARRKETDGGAMDCSWVLPPGLEATLFDYQRKTVAWMVQQEELPRGMSTYVYNTIPTADGVGLYLCPNGKLSKEPPLQAKGGAIFSTMGTGKTIMTLALIMARPRHPEDCDLSFKGEQDAAWAAACDRQRGAPKYRGVASELLTVKASLYNGVFAPRRFRGRASLIIAPVSLVGQWASEIRKHTPGASVVLWHGDTRNQENFGKILSSDVVLTTYELLASCSALFGMIDWHRVVFDESQRMKNPSIKLVWFAQRISAGRRWLLSGTPISHTGLKDLGGQLAALHAPDAFWDVECLDKEAAGQASSSMSVASRSAQHKPMRAIKAGFGLHQAAVFVLWWRCVARRQTVQGLIQRGEIELPESQEETLIIPFSSLSQEEQLVYQAIRKSIVKVFKRVSMLAARKSLSAAYIRSLSLLRRLRMAIGDILSVLDDAAGVEQEDTDDGKGAEMLPSAKAAGSTPKEQLTSFIAASPSGGSTEAAMQRILSVCEEDCIICFCPLLELSILPCLHLVCKDCWKQLLSCSGGRSADCPMCRTPAKNGSALLFSQSDALKLLEGEADAEEESPVAAATTGTVADAIATLKARQQSSKISFAVRHVEATLRQEPGSKIIVFSQFTKTVHSMARALRRVGVKSCLITGATSMNARTQQLYEFAHDDTTRVFVLSIRSAGVGLNLTAANHVLFMEPNENIALVSQAVSRVLRLGQTKFVKVAHLQVDDSVEADISAWAERIRATQGIRADTQAGEHVSELARVNSLRNTELPASATMAQGGTKESKGRLQQRWEDITKIFASITQREAAAPGAAAAVGLKQ